jgi:hypothetical protein
MASRMEIKTHERVVEERHAITVDEIDIGGDRFIFRYHEEITRTGAKPKLIKKEGIATSRQLKDLRAGREAAYERYFVFDDERLADVIRMGYTGISYDRFKATDDNHTSVFEHVAKGGDIKNIVRFYNYDHSFWRADGTLLPTGIAFHYIEPAIHNGAYDLDKLVEILRAREDVMIMAATESGMARYNQPYGSKPKVAEPGEEIDDIPYYNRSRGQTKTVTFFWTPSQEVSERLRSDYTNRYKIVFDEDMLGLRAGGAALYDTFYKQGDDRSLEDDDD